MTAQTLAFAPEQTPAVGSWFNHRRPTQTVSPPKRDRLETHTESAPSFEWSGSVLAEAMREGVMVLCRNLKPLYLNRQAQELCKILSEPHHHWGVVPGAISEICHKLIKSGSSTTQPLVLEYQTSEGQTIRIRASWLNVEAGENGDRQYILVFLENRDEILQEELQFEQQKYQLTDREMEIWRLLRQEYSYQDIAATLHISLNTVKTHVKNIYAKKRWNQVQHKALVG